MYYVINFVSLLTTKHSLNFCVILAAIHVICMDLWGLNPYVFQNKSTVSHNVGYHF